MCLHQVQSFLDWGERQNTSVMSYTYLGVPSTDCVISSNVYPWEKINQVPTCPDCRFPRMSHGWCMSQYMYNQGVLNHGARTQFSSISVQCFISQNRRRKSELLVKEGKWTILYGMVQNANVAFYIAGFASCPTLRVKTAGSCFPLLLPSYLVSQHF